MDKQLLADITTFNKYAKFIPELQRRENYHEIVERNCAMHQTKYPQLADEIAQVYRDFVHTKKVLPSMRSMQFGGKPILLSESRLFNCAYRPAETHKFFSELMFLLLGGTGVGYSVQSRHVSQLPKIKAPESDQEYKFQIQDSILGWSDAIKVVAKAFFNAGTLPVFDYRDIREKGADLITSGGKAPGPEPLRHCIEAIIPIFRNAVGRRLRPIEVHDIACCIADSVLAGGIRRAAMLCLFDRDDMEMLTCKALVPVAHWEVLNKGAEGTPSHIRWRDAYGNTGEAHLTTFEVAELLTSGKLPWYRVYPWRARANNSVTLLRGTVSKGDFASLMRIVQLSGCGEPGIYWTNNLDWGSNPCVEAALPPYTMCNLTTINAGVITDQASYNQAAAAAAFIGTLQAGYTDFHYLNPKWKQACEREALLGVSMTGIASGTLESLNEEVAVQCALQTNEATARKLGIRPATRVTMVKPEGTSSLVLGTSSGIHAWHAPYYIRRMRAGKDEALAQHMMFAAPGLVEEDVTNPNQVVMSFPQKAPEGAILRDEPMMSLLSRVKRISQRWIAPGHRSGDNHNNVSCTVSVKDDEWEDLTEWMWDNRDHYNGISVMPFYGSDAYPQMPFEDITQAQYEAMLPLLEGIDISQIREKDGSAINLKAELACAGNVCELTAL